MYIIRDNTVFKYFMLCIKYRNLLEILNGFTLILDCGHLIKLLIKSTKLYPYSYENPPSL